MLGKILNKIAVKISMQKYVHLGIPAIIQNDKGEILLGKRSMHVSCYPLVWGLPGGLVEKGETIEEAIKREVKEEIDVEVKVIRFGKPFMSFPNEKCPFQSINIPVYCKIINGKPKPKSETSECKWFNPKKMRNMKLAYEHKKLLKQEKLI